MSIRALPKASFAFVKAQNGSFLTALGKAFIRSFPWQNKHPASEVDEGEDVLENVLQICQGINTHEGFSQRHKKLKRLEMRERP